MRGKQLAPSDLGPVWSGCDGAHNLFGDCVIVWRRVNDYVVALGRRRLLMADGDTPIMRAAAD